MCAMRACDANDQARRRKDAVIRPQNGRPKPTKAPNGMAFRTSRETNHVLSSFYSHTPSRTCQRSRNGVSHDRQAMEQNRLHRIQHESEDDRSPEYSDENPDRYGGHQESIRRQQADDRDIYDRRHNKPSPRKGVPEGFSF